MSATTVRARRRKAAAPLPSVPDDYDERYVACRDLRHAWSENGWYRGSAGGVHRFLTCMRCGTERHDDFFGPAPTHHYVYPADYHVYGGVDVAALRFELRDRAKIARSIDDLREVDLREL